MSNDTQAPNVNIGEQNVPENLAEQSGLPNMSSTKVFKVETDMLVLGDVYADNFIGRGAAGGTYATQVGFNPEDPLDTASVVLDAGTDGTDSLLTVKTIITDGTVDFTGATLIGIPDLVGISLTDLSVSVGAAGVANLEYDNTTGVFTYTPPDLSSYLTASSTDTLTNKSGSNSQWTNDEGYTTNVGTTTADNVQTFTNKSGSNSQWTNDEGYIDLTDLSVSVATEGTANLSYDNISGVFTYTPPSLDGYLPLSGGTLTAPLYFEDGGITVGSIGTAGGELYIAHDGITDSGLRFRGGGEIIPANSGGAGTNGISNLGSAGFRFKDLHLSGTAYVATIVGIGTSSPISVIDARASGVSTPSVLSLVGTNSASSDSCISQIKSSENPAGGGASDLTFHTRSVGGSFTAPSERMRISSAGNVLLNRSTAFTTAKMEIQSDAGDASTLALNSINTDGSILEFYKAGTTVGSIGNTFGRLFIGSGNTGIRFIGDTSEVSPWNTSTNSGRDAAISLGNSGNRFKDLYLSGGVYLGGTGVANKLDDYEEGTWTPTITGSTSGSATLTVNQALYTKVGRAVHVSCYIINANVTGLVGTIIVGGLPFTANGFAMTKSGYSTLFSFDQQTIEVAGYTENGAAYIRLQRGSSITGITGTDATAAGDGRIMMNFTYQTS